MKRFMGEKFGGRGVLRVVPPAVLNAAIKADDEKKAAAASQNTSDVALSNLASHIRTQFEIMRTHRNSAAGWSERLIVALRAFNGQYDADQARPDQTVRRLGSLRAADLDEVPRRQLAAARRLSFERPPWGIEPIGRSRHSAGNHRRPSASWSVSKRRRTPRPAAGPTQRDPRSHAPLMEAARQAAKKRAAEQAEIAEDKIDELLTEGKFYKALAEFLVDLPLFPFACIKGPVVRIVPTVVWKTGKALVKQKPRLFWKRISPFDLWWTPGVRTSKTPPSSSAPASRAPT
jgi:hypothetical protein